MFSNQNFDHISSQKDWNFTQNDFKAEQILAKVQDQARKDMPPSIYTSYVMTHYNLMRQHKLYSLMKTIPKGSLHHLHIDCCQDKDYYRQFVIRDPIIYLSEDKTTFKVGTKKQAEEGKWVSWEKLRETYKTQDQLVDFVSNLTMFNDEDNRKNAAKQFQFWVVFEKKIVTFFTVLFTLHHFKTYIKFVCEKFIKNGYDRIEFRSMTSQLTEYDAQGNVVKVHPDQKYLEVLDEVEVQLKKEHPNFSIGVVFFGLKVFSPEQNEQIFTKICEMNWSKTLGFDLVQEQDAYGSLKSYDDVVSKVLAKYPHLNYKKVYHAGETRDPLNKNIEIAVKAGSVRIGHGINILQRMEFLSQCKHISFEVNPISNMLTHLRDDTRIATPPVLMSLGYALTINPDDPGKFGYEDSTVDYFSSFISFKWSLKELKLLGIHSIHHSICSEEEKVKLLASFNKRWDQWVIDIIKSQE